MGIFLCDATMHFISKPPESEEAELAAIVVEVVRAVPEKQASLQRSVQMLRQSRLVLDRKLRAAGVRK